MKCPSGLSRPRIFPALVTQYRRKVLAVPVLKVNWQAVLDKGASGFVLFAGASAAKQREEKAIAARARTDLFTSVSPSVGF